MTDVTFSIDDEVCEKMNDFSKVRWNEFVKKCIQKRIEQLQIIEISDWENLDFLADEKILSESWLSDEDEKAFEYLR